MLARACRGKKTSLKAALLDQRVVAGLGNIYVCEALHRALLSPKRSASTIATRTGAPDRAHRTFGRGHQGGAQRCHQGRRIVAARSQTNRRRPRHVPASLSASTIAKAHGVRLPAAAAPSSASCRTDVRRFIARPARSDFYIPPLANGHEPPVSRSALMLPSGVRINRRACDRHRWHRAACIASHSM